MLFEHMASHVKLLDIIDKMQAQIGVLLLSLILFNCIMLLVSVITIALVVTAPDATGESRGFISGIQVATGFSVVWMFLTLLIAKAAGN